MAILYRRRVRVCTTCRQRLDTTAARRQCEAACGSPKGRPHIIGALSGNSDRSAKGILDPYPVRFRTIAEFVEHYHRERNHQGLKNEPIDVQAVQETVASDGTGASAARSITTRELRDGAPEAAATRGPCPVPCCVYPRRERGLLHGEDVEQPFW